MTDFVVDTNVFIVAHGRDGNWDLTCQSTCVEMLEKICQDYVIVIDDAYHILGEYERALKQLEGAESISHKFFKHVHTKRGSNQVPLVSITPVPDEKRGFEQLPKNELDPSDRKFLAVAVEAQAEIVNATDSDWSEQGELTSRLGVTVRQLCPQHAQKQTSGG